MIFITVEEVIDYHVELLQVFGGAQGIRDMGLLILAVEIPKASFIDQDLYDTVFEKGAAYLYHMIANHPFVAGNQRIALLTALVFFRVNNILIAVDSSELEGVVLAVEAGRMKKAEIADFFKKTATSIKRVRLSAHDLAAVERVFKKNFLHGDALWLFGSRADLSRKGGDIDLYVETNAASVAKASKMRSKFIGELEQAIGEQKIDVVLNMLNFPYPLPIHEIAKKNGVRLI